MWNEIFSSLKSNREDFTPIQLQFRNGEVTEQFVVNGAFHLDRTWIVEGVTESGKAVRFRVGKSWVIEQL